MMYNVSLFFVFQFLGLNNFGCPISILVNFCNISLYPFYVQWTAFCLIGVLVTRNVDQEPKQEPLRFRQHMEVNYVTT